MKKKRIINKILLIFELQILVIAAVTIGSVFSVYSTAIDNVRVTSAGFLSLLGKDINQKLSDGERVLDELVYDSSEYVLLQSEEEKVRYYATMDINKTMKDLVANTGVVEFVVVAENDYQNFVMAEKTGLTLDIREDAKAHMLGLVAQENIYSKWGYVSLGGRKYVTKAYVWRGRGAAVFISVDKLLKISEDAIADTSIFLMENDQVIECINAADSKSYDEILTIIEKSPKRFIENRFEIAEGELQLVGYTNLRNLRNQIMNERILLVVFLIISFVIAVFVGFQLKREIAVPMEMMQENMKRIESGDYQHRIDEEYPNFEFENLRHAFNKMMDEIVDLKIAKYEKQIELSESELRSIRLQIRPHFFLNALTTISSLSMQGKNEQIAKYIEALSKNVRYMFKSGLHTVELGEEINHVENYLEMQELKYPESVFCFTSCDESLYSWKVPQMIIHTIIENEYKYAVIMDNLLSIYINIGTVEKDGETLLKIQIEDDGKGYPEDVLKDFENPEKRTTDGSRVGLWSIRKMLSIMYDRDDLFEISNIEPRGAQSVIYLPAEPVNEVGKPATIKHME